MAMLSGLHGARPGEGEVGEQQRPSPRAPTAIFASKGTSVSGDQNASTNAAAKNMTAAPYMMRTAGFAAAISAALAAAVAGRDRPRGRGCSPAAPESTMASSSSDEWPATNDQKVSLIADLR